ncbi:MAG: ribokinase [Terrimicrobiaceae bacterium]|nr:ribokinase [Terrimicrobiaceae bacterium]
MKVAIVGSIMVDLVTRCQRYPERGETLSAEAFTIVSGGKGANQAVACAKMGCEATLIGAVGADPFAEIALGLLGGFGVNVRHIFHSAASATGTASIVIDGTSENTILVARGANNDLSVGHLDRCAEAISKSDALLVQLEIHLPVVERAMQIAHEAGIPILLDPAPAQQIPDRFLALADFVTPNAQEAKTLTKVEPIDLATARQAAAILHGRGARQVVIKRGPAGCLVSTGVREEVVEGIAVLPVDTVGAGDCFAGALIARWLETRDLVEACRFANAAASLKVQRPGAQSGIPSREEVDAHSQSPS